VSLVLTGAHTQYLTRVQGMPESTIKKLNKMIDNHIHAKRGERKSNTISIEQLQRPIEEGGLGVLNIPARNDTIELMRLKQYLRPDGLRPIWAYLADLILAECAAKKYKGVGTQALRNQFIQNWNSNLKNSAMPDSLKRMIRAARKHQVQFAPEILNKELRLNVDIWFHPEIEGRTPAYKDRWSRCQKETHAIQTVNDMRNHAQKNEYHEHTPNDENCGCPHCFQDRADGCEMPNECRQSALQKLSKLKIEWRPET
ncbi:hypothetical protein BKA70DRAFT_1045014, partial [Coprinopsis sp. MPI-PUGE-AT-0042]